LSLKSDFILIFLTQMLKIKKLKTKFF